MQHEYEAKRSELLEAEQKVDELRKQLEQALLVAREKREAAVAAKRKFEAARRRLDAEMATVREKVPRFMLHSIQGGSISRKRNQTRKHGAMQPAFSPVCVCQPLLTAFCMPGLCTQTATVSMHNVELIWRRHMHCMPSAALAHADTSNGQC